MVVLVGLEAFMERLGPSWAELGANWVPKFCSLTQRSLCLKERAADLACADRIPLGDQAAGCAGPSAERRGLACAALRDQGVCRHSTGPRSLPDEAPPLHAQDTITPGAHRPCLGQGLVDQELLYTAINWLQRDRPQF